MNELINIGKLFVTKLSSTFELHIEGQIFDVAGSLTRAISGVYGGRNNGAE